MGPAPPEKIPWQTAEIYQTWGQLGTVSTQSRDKRGLCRQKLGIDAIAEAAEGGQQKQKQGAPSIDPPDPVKLSCTESALTGGADDGGAADGARVRGGVAERRGAAHREPDDVEGR